MNNEVTKKIKIKKGYFLILVPFIALFMDFLIYEQKKLIGNSSTSNKAVSNIFWIGAVGASVILLLIILFIWFYSREKSKIKEKKVNILMR